MHVLVNAHSVVNQYLLVFSTVLIRLLFANVFGCHLRSKPQAAHRINKLLVRLLSLLKDAVCLWRIRTAFRKWNLASKGVVAFSNCHGQFCSLTYLHMHKLLSNFWWTKVDNLQRCIVRASPTVPNGCMHSLNSSSIPYSNVTSHCDCKGKVLWYTMIFNVTYCWELQYAVTIYSWCIVFL